MKSAGFLGGKPHKTIGKWNLKCVPYKNVPQRNPHRFIKSIFEKIVLFKKGREVFLKTSE